MPKCPHCGEVYRHGQQRCYACGQQVRSRAAGRKGGVNPLVFIGAGAAALVAVVGMIILIPKEGRGREKAKITAEQERVADSVRKANRERVKEVGEVKQQSRLMSTVTDLEDRLRRIKQQVIGRKTPTPEQTKLIGQINSDLGRMRMLVGAIDRAPAEKQGPLKDTLHATRRHAQALISDLTRAPKPKSPASP